jgi:hypothetical protein
MAKQKQPSRTPDYRTPEMVAQHLSTLQAKSISTQTSDEIPHKPHYNVRTAAQSYSNIAAVVSSRLKG